MCVCVVECFGGGGVLLCVMARVVEYVWWCRWSVLDLMVGEWLVME